MMNLVSSVAERINMLDKIMDELDELREPV
jgi:hypothetical protein